MTPAMTRHCWLRLQTISSLYVSRPQSGLLNPKVLGVNIKTFVAYQVPGGMLSNLVSQLKEAGQEDKYRQVLEIPRGVGVRTSASLR